jgi:hypothetical protein
MSKTGKKKALKEPKTGNSSGLLLSLDGTHGAALAAEAERLARLASSDKDPAWSQWDASNTFHELGMVKARNLTPTPRTLLLLYASDLLFRLRWEIEPTLEEGRTVVAAPYVESAVAFGVAAGLSREWLEELFGFAPKPAVCFRLKEKKKGKKKAGEAGAGFVEFCCASLSKNYPGWDAGEVRAGMLEYLKDLEDREVVRKLGKRLPKSVASLTRE